MQDNYTFHKLDGKTQLLALAYMKIQAAKSLLPYLKPTTEAEQLEAVKQHWQVIRYIKAPSYAVQALALECSDGEALKYIKHPDKGLAAWWIIKMPYNSTVLSSYRHK